MGRRLIGRSTVKQYTIASEDAAHLIPGSFGGEFCGLEIDTPPPDVAPMVGKPLFGLIRIPRRYNGRPIAQSAIDRNQEGANDACFVETARRKHHDR